MDGTSTFFIGTACVAGVSPLGVDLAARPSRAGRVARRRSLPTASGPDDRFVAELLATFSARWEW